MKSLPPSGDGLRSRVDSDGMDSGVHNSKADGGSKEGSEAEMENMKRWLAHNLNFHPKREEG